MGSQSQSPAVETLDHNSSQNLASHDAQLQASDNSCPNQASEEQKLKIQRPLLSENGLTNTHSGTDRDQSGGEEETSSRRRRRSRWDPPPTEFTNDGTGGGDGSGTGRKRKSRWADDGPKPVIQLPDFMKDFTGGIEFDPEIQALNSRLLEISRKLQSGMPLDDRP